MKFVDEAKIQVKGGDGGDGCVSFRREKFIPRGGPDGGDGGSGGSVYLQVNAGLNTLADFRHKHICQAKNGQPGMGRQCNGGNGQDLYIEVPLGTLVYDHGTNELIGDLTGRDDVLLVAKGGRHGLGNTRFKSSTNRAPRKKTKGELGELRELRLELSLLADVGLLGLPNAGKSTLIRRVSASRAKVADYPFTTLYPNLGVVEVDQEKRFTIADIPGLIRGAAQGLGLGIAFLKHLSRTHLLLHLVDISIVNDINTTLSEIQTIEQELEHYSASLLKKERWLALNKCDAIPIAQATALARQIKQRIGTVDEVFVISGLSGYHCQQLMQRIAQWLEQQSKRNTSE